MDLRQKMINRKPGPSTVALLPETRLRIKEICEKNNWFQKDFVDAALNEILDREEKTLKKKSKKPQVK